MLGLLITQGFAQSEAKKPEKSPSRGFFSGVNFNPFARSSNTDTDNKKETKIDVEKEELKALKQQMEQNFSNLEQARQHYLRRQKVIDKMRFLALQTDDERLIRRVDELDQRNDALNNRKLFYSPGTEQFSPNDSGTAKSFLRNP